MAKVETTYLGISVKNPVIVSSSGLANNVQKVVKLSEAGAGAIVLKSIFEEQINLEAGTMMNGADYPEAHDYIRAYSKSNTLDLYLKLIEDAKKNVDTPIFASVNCVSASEWISFAKSVEEAGADALELNIFYLPNTTKDAGESIEETYFHILREVRKAVSIPIVMKLSQQFSNLPVFINKLKGYGANAVVLFNRFYAPDINTETLTMSAADVFSHPSEIRNSLRWVGIISSVIPGLEVCASTGIHDGLAVVKQLLAGAKTVQVCSALYKNGPDFLAQIIRVLGNWMDKHNFESIAEFRGRLSYKNIPDPGIFERAQFMKYYSNMV